MSDFIQELSKRAALVDQALEALLPSPETFPPLIHQAMRYSVLEGGKRLRPVLMLAAAEAVGGKAQDFISAACAFELIHAYSLVHDDLPAMDNDDYRRGKLSNHKVYGEATAILTGDALLTMAMQLLAESSGKPENVLRVIRETAIWAGSQGLIGGQVVDTLSEGIEFDEATIEYIHNHKTGALFKAAVRAGAILAGATEAQITALTSYAEYLGLAFQIKDDILDLEGNEQIIGKAVGSDAKNNKATYPALFGLSKSRDKAREAAGNALSSLQGFGAEADFLRSMVNYVIERDF
ncbi:MAG: polyprenyl synthetase family protein [Peptococcaceae bacterium]|jgi:geranylgeranyl diphosphate synthase type II|nr:polyprenyl synthetase family protein [Peptococcaceae bacterium]